MSGRLTHFDGDGRPIMVDVSGKDETDRTAAAGGVVIMSGEALARARARSGGKGDVFTVAEIAGINAAKKTSELIPLCHNLSLTSVSVSIAELPDGAGLDVHAILKTTGRTGVEMEALTAVSVSCLTIYDMLKAVDPAMRIERIRLLQKTGGRTADYKASS